MRALGPATLAAGAAALLLACLARLADPAGAWASLCGPQSRWNLDLWVLLRLGLAGVLYGTGLLRLEARSATGRGHPPGRALAYAGGWLALAVALVSPLHRWGEGLFSAHMIEHELVMAVAAPLLALSRPGAVFLWGLPAGLRNALAAGLGTGAVRASWQALTRPATATLLHGLAIWAWHAPPLFDAAVANVALHRLQHLAFLVTALLFWWALSRRRPGAAFGPVVLTMLHTSVLGALLALSPRVLFPAQTAGASAWGLTPLEDQQLAGLLMWVPAGTVYAAAALWLAARWITQSGAGWRLADAPRPL